MEKLLCADEPHRGNSLPVKKGKRRVTGSPCNNRVLKSAKGVVVLSAEKSEVYR